MFEYLGPEMSFGKRIVMANLWLFDGLLASMLAKSPATAAMLHTTTAPTMLTGSVKENLLPSRAVAVVNFRLLPGDSVASVIDHVTKAVDDPRVKVTAIGYQTEPSPVSNVDSWGFATVQKTIIQVFPDALVAPFLMIAGTDGKWWKADADAEDSTDAQIVIALGDGATDALIMACVVGYVRDDSWSWTASTPLVISGTAGAMVAMPGSSTFIKPVAVAETSQIIFFCPDLTFLEKV